MTEDHREVLDRVHALVQDCRDRGVPVHGETIARQIMEETPDCRLSLAQIASAVVSTAIRYAVPVETSAETED